MIISMYAGELLRNRNVAEQLKEKGYKVDSIERLDNYHNILSNWKQARFNMLILEIDNSNISKERVLIKLLRDNKIYIPIIAVSQCNAFGAKPGDPQQREIILEKE